MSGVSQSWSHQVSSYLLFTTIVKSIKDVVEQSNNKEIRQVKSKAVKDPKAIMTQDEEVKEYTSSR
jgi:hypothetical protein